MKRIVVIAAHPDDEILGVGGTLARHQEAGDQVHAIIVSEGATARYADSAKVVLLDSTHRAAEVMGFASVVSLGLPDQRLDTISLLEVVQALEGKLSEIRADELYTHHSGDLNRDHRIVSEAVMVATRPIGDGYPRRILFFETPSSTEWSPPGAYPPFQPNVFVDISTTIDRKLAAMACYETELRPAPHPRSLMALRSRAAYWGQIVTRPYAEAFVLAREVN